MIEFKNQNRGKKMETKAIDIINFHGLSMVVVEHQKQQYIAAKPLIELIGIQWKRARNTLFSEDNTVLYGTTEILDPVLDRFWVPRDTKKSVYILLERSRMFLARVNTSQMRVNGKQEAADSLLKLQIEWAGVLHKYENNEVVIKSQKRDKDMFSLISKLDSVKDATLKTIYATQLNEKYGLSIPIGKQESLEL